VAEVSLTFHFPSFSRYRKLENQEGALTPGVVVHTSNPALGSLRQEDLKFQNSLSYLGRQLFKKRKERADRVAPVVGHLPSKCEPLSSNHRTAIKKKKERDSEKEKSSLFRLIKIFTG
jgi:hypothetical protein